MLKIENIHKKFSLEAGFFAKAGRFVYAVNGVSFVIKEDEVYGLVGESGCGKTTLAKLIVKMYPLNGGNIVFTDKRGEGFDYSRMRKRETRIMRTRIKYIFQDPARSLNPRMSVLETLTAGYRYAPSWPGKEQALIEARAIMAAVGLSPDDLSRRPQDFSGGQRQRISIARALIMRPELLICDEVVSSLDVSIQSQILALLLKLKEQYGLHMLFIAHDLAVVTYICDRVGVMYGGMLMEEASSTELLARPVHPYTKHLYKALPKIAAASVQAVLPDIAGDAVHVSDLQDPTREPVGCPYYDRCPQKTDICKTARPELRDVAEGHRVACHCCQ